MSTLSKRAEMKLLAETEEGQVIELQQSKGLDLEKLAKLASRLSKEDINNLEGSVQEGRGE